MISNVFDIAHAATRGALVLLVACSLGASGNDITHDITIIFGSTIPVPAILPISANPAKQTLGNSRGEVPGIRQIARVTVSLAY